MGRKIKIAPSILSADFGCLNEEIAQLEDYVELFHVDVMDGHFVPNLTLGAPVVACIKTRRLLDVHLMIEAPEKYLEDFVKAGAGRLIVHYEAVGDLDFVLRKIHALGVETGISIKPATAVEVLKPYLKQIDEVLVMTVEPGFGGQEFMSEQLEKVRWLREQGFAGEIGVDGGINEQTIQRAAEAGATILVAGSAIYGQKDPVKAVKKLQELV